MRELDADGNVIDYEVYTFCEVWKASCLTTFYLRICCLHTLLCHRRRI